MFSLRHNHVADRPRRVAGGPPGRSGSDHTLFLVDASGQVVQQFLGVGSGNVLWTPDSQTAVVSMFSGTDLVEYHVDGTTSTLSFTPDYGVGVSTDGF